MVSVAISIPRLYSKPLEKVRLGKCVSIEHASLNCRSTETIFALAIAETQDSLIISNNVPHLIYLAAAWNLEHKFKRLDRGWYAKTDSGELWLCKTTDDAKAIPKRSFGAIYIIDAHEQPINPITIFDGAHKPSIVMAGRLSERAHWFYAESRKEKCELFRYDADSILKQFPDQVDNVLDKRDPRYEREMLLKDVRPQSVPFVVFARKRLKIRTDKPSQFLSKEQQDEARLQLGETWESGLVGAPIVKFQTSTLQKRYLAQKRLAVAKGKKPWYLLLKYRRGGFSTIEQGLSYKLAVTTQNSYVSTIAHTTPSTQRIAKISHIFHEYDPLAPVRVDESSTSMEFANGSYFYMGTAGGVGVARGDTLQKVHGSEVSKWCIGPNQQSKVDDLLAGVLGAASNGEVVLETTPNGHEAFHALYVEAKNPASNSPFTPIFVRWFDDPANVCKSSEYNEVEILDTLSDEELSLIEKEELTIAQIAFRRQKKAQFKRLFLQEWPEDDSSCFLTSGLCFFDQEACLSLIEKMPEPNRTSHGAGVMDIWEEPINGVEYCAGTDTSEGLAAPCDPNGTAIIRRDTGKQVARIYGRYKPRDLCDRSLSLLKRYGYPLWGIERNNHGHAVLERLNNVGPDVYKFSHSKGGRLFHYNGDRSGWYTDSQSRPLLLDELDSFIQQHPDTFSDAEMFREACTFTQGKNGKFEASGGSHDDTLFMWGIALQMRKHKQPKLDVFFG
jgi:hypothetical protein